MKFQPITYSCSLSLYSINIKWFRQYGGREDGMTLKDNFHKVRDLVHMSFSGNSDNNSNTNRSKPSVLVVEDDALTMKLVKHLLGKTFGIEPVTMQNGMEAQDYLDEHVPDVIILDLMLPGKTGYEILKDVQNNPNLEKTRVILISAKSRAEDIERGFDLNADEYITKPFQPKEFTARFKKVLNAVT